ncbi:hypothetical protein R3P38DRAFT_3186936 [Favolaschia claudopus]|uniref:Uncharacterized protein n=1 Tax=Favolaschia claudopus TaxID=2862362 RepID=A0AAW0C301_9AGAR
MLWAASPSLVSPSPVIGARHPPHPRSAFARSSTFFSSTFAAPAAALYRRWLVVLSWGPGQRSHWASSPSLVLPSPTRRRFASPASTLTAAALFGFGSTSSVWIRIGRVAA